MPNGGALRHDLSVRRMSNTCTTCPSTRARRCAGLSVFKPYRLLLRTAAAGMLALLLARHGLTRRTLGTVVASLLLTYSEDALAVLNTSGSLRMLLQRAGLMPGSTGRSSPAPPPPALVRWRLAVDGMRCQACAARVRGSLSHLPGVHNASVKLDEGSVEVWADRKTGPAGEELVGIVAALDSSYGVSLAERSCYGTHQQPVPCSARAATAAAAGGQAPEVLGGQPSTADGVQPLTDRRRPGAAAVQADSPQGNEL